MKRNPSPRTKLLVFIIAFCWTCCTAFGQDPRLDLSYFDALPAEEAVNTVDIALEGPVLQMAASMFNRNKNVEEAEIREMIDSLEGIYIKSYKFDKPGKYQSYGVIEGTERQLAGWSRIIYASNKQNGETTDVYVMPDGETGIIQGLGILITKPLELTVVNIVGQIDMEKLSELQGKMGIPDMDLSKKPDGQ